jgi:p-cumate 2,3-dioxygenase beta subunit
MTEALPSSKVTLEDLLLQYEVEQFLYKEAYLLDQWLLDQWLELFTKDARYVVPTTDLPEGDPQHDRCSLTTTALDCRAG